MDALLTEWNPLVRSLIVAAGVVVAALLVHVVIYRVYARLGRRSPALLPLDGILLDDTRAAVRFLLPVLALYLSLPLIGEPLPDPVVALAGDLLYVLLVVAVAWLLVRLTAVVQHLVGRHYEVGTADNLTARKVHTQLSIVRRILTVGIVVLALAAVLMYFESFRQLGAGLLASAGVVGIVVGFAAQRTLGNLLAGFQIAITQPIRVDDVVVVEGEWGRVEEITLTYVVVRIWDLRRLVLPISYFIEQPFQNWTRTSASILGTVFLHVDYTVPVEAVRAELERLLQASEYWDGEVWRLHVTDTSERTVELRALMSAADSGSAFELRAEIREKLIAFVQQTYPDALPRLRATLTGEGEPASLGANGTDEPA